MLIENPGARWLWVDTVQINIKKYIERYFIPILGLFWETVDWDKEKNILKFANGSTLDFWSAERPENLEWFEYDFWVLNEAGIILKKEWLWENTLEPMFKNAQVKIVGTPKGKTGKDWELQKFAQMSEWAKYDPEWAEFSYSCYDSPFWTFEQLEKIRERVPGYVWKQEYLAEHIDLYENSMLTPDDIVHYDTVDLDKFQKVYMHADITHTGKSTSDYFSCGVMGMWPDKKFYMLDYVLEKMDEETQARAAIVLYMKWGRKVQKFTYDEKWHQGFGFWIRKLARDEYDLSLPIEELKYPKDKVTHFAPHVPHFKAKRVLMPANHKRMTTAQDQLLAFPNKDVNDDIVDVVSSLLDNFHLGDNIYFTTSEIEMQPVREPIKVSGWWAYHNKKIPGNKYAIGAMVASGRSTIVVFDCTKREVCALFTGDEHIGEDLAVKGMLYNNAIIGVNADKHGSQVIQVLKNKNYPKIFERMEQTTYDDKDTDRLWVLINPTTKGIIMSQLNLALKYLALFIVSSTIKEELLRYPREAIESNDDENHNVLALAIAYDIYKKSGSWGKITIS